MLDDLASEAPAEGQAEATPAVVVCTRCGLANKPKERFCRSCSAFLEWSGQPMEAAAAVEVPMAEQELDLGPTRLRERAWDWAVYGARGPQVAPLPPAMAPGADGVDWSAPTVEPEDEDEAVVPGVVRPDQVTAVLPVIGARRPVAEVEEADTGCRACGAGNSASRHFCRRCGATLAVPMAPARQSRWQRKHHRREQRKLSKGQLDLGGRPRRKRQALGGIGGGWITSLVAKIFLGACVAGAVVSMVGPEAKPIQHTVSGWYTSVRETIAPQYDPVNPVGATASSAVSGHPALDAVDGRTDTYWAASGTAVGQSLIIDFGQPSSIDQVGFLIGVPGANYLNQPRPQLLHLTFNNGSTADISLVDSSSFQTFKVYARRATQVQVVVEAEYQSAVGQNIAITEIEFRMKK